MIVITNKMKLWYEITHHDNLLYIINISIIKLTTKDTRYPYHSSKLSLLNRL